MPIFLKPNQLGLSHTGVGKPPFQHYGPFILVTVDQVRRPNARLPLQQPKAGLIRKMLEKFCDPDSNNSVNR